MYSTVYTLFNIIDNSKLLVRVHKLMVYTLVGISVNWMSIYVQKLLVQMDFRRV